MDRSIRGQRYILRQRTTLTGVHPVQALGIYLADGSCLAIKNNIITNGVCIKEADATSDPLSIENNDLFNCSVAYYDFDGGCSGNGDGIANTRTIAEMNLLSDTSTTAANNRSDDPAFLDPKNYDYHFSPSSPLIYFARQD